MSGWLAGFRSSGGNTASEPQPFEVICECNVRHSGVRKKVHQRIVCRTCGVSLFVLPRDVYPPPPDAERIKKKAKPKPTNREGGESAPERVSRHKRRREDAGSDSNPLATAASLTSAAFQVAAGATGRAARATASTTARATVNAAQGFWSFWTPLRVVGLAIVLMLGGIGLWSLNARKLERAEQALNPAIEEGLAALERGEIPLAADRLQTAVESLDLLGQHDRHAESVRQAHREARALDQLSDESLLEILEQADEVVEKAATGRKPAQRDPDEDEELPPLDADWVNRFAALHAGGWVVLEAPVKRLAPTAEHPLRFEIGFPIGIGPKQHAVELRADSPVFDVLGVGQTPRTVIFGGRLESVRFHEQRGTWQVRIEPDSGFLWASLPTYRRLGFLFSEWHPQAEVEAQLAAQAEALNVDILVKAEPSVEPNLPAE